VYENVICIDLVKESLNFDHDGRAALLLSDVAGAAVQSRSRLEAENAALRQRLAMRRNAAKFPFSPLVMDCRPYGCARRDRGRRPDEPTVQVFPMFIFSLLPPVTAKTAIPFLARSRLPEMFRSDR
jgi:hypothetical protein